jgi:hypothetical protein
MNDLPIVADIRREWDWVRPGVEEIIAGQPQLTYRPEDVYAACVNQEATLFVRKGASGNDFAVTMIEVDKYSGHKVMVMWLANIEQRGRKQAIRLMEFFDQVGRDCGCSYIEGKTAFEALGEYYLKNGWDLNTKVYTRKL